MKGYFNRVLRIDLTGGYGESYCGGTIASRIKGCGVDAVILSGTCACIKSDTWRSLGRGGMGAVLGSKNVKGIGFAGSMQAEVVDEHVLKQGGLGFLEGYPAAGTSGSEKR